MSYDLSLDRKSTVILGAGSVFLVLLVFVAGFLAGVSWRRDEMIAVIRQNSATVAAAAPKQPGSPKANADAAKPAAAPASEPAAPSAPAASKAADEPPPAPAAAPAVATQAAAVQPVAPPAATSLSAAPEQSGVRLSIQVGSFREKSNAEKLADQLKHSGYNPQIVLAGIGSKQWNIVRVGPYQDWDEASQIAAQLSRSQSTQAVIHPIR